MRPGDKVADLERVIRDAITLQVSRRTPTEPGVGPSSLDGGEMGLPA